jgi:hypothetical protein
MTPQEQQMIESLFQRLTQGAPQAGPRDPQAEALIQQHVQNLPGAAYYMAQTLLVQEHALQQAEARLAALQQGAQGQGSFLPQGAGGPAYPYGAPPPQYAAGAPPAYQQQQPGAGMGGFLAGAGKIALGVGGGILVADAAMSLGRDLFGGHGGFGGGYGGGGFGGGYGQGYEQGFDQGRDEAIDRDQDDGGFGDQGDQGDFGGGGDSGSSDW